MTARPGSARIPAPARPLPIHAGPSRDGIGGDARPLAADGPIAWSVAQVTAGEMYPGLTIHPDGRIGIGLWFKRGRRP